MHYTEVKGILSPKNGMNVYRGCTHGCIYCDSRSLCYNMTHDFENIEVKINAPLLLEKALRSKRKLCMIGTGAMCDPYMHCEKELLITRKCLEIIDKYGFGAAVQTKSDLILRDLDLLKSINEKAKTVVQMTLTTYDEKLCSILEPNTASTLRRYEVLKIMQEHCIPTIVWISPLLPFINDTEDNLRGILNYCFDSGVKGIICFGIGTTIREGSREYFYSMLDKHFSGMKEKYIRTYGNAYECNSPNNNRLMKIFHEECEKRGILHYPDEIFRYLNEFPENDIQMRLF